MLDGSLVKTFLAEERVHNIEVISLETVDSTNLYARDQIDQGRQQPFLVVANQQTAGYGRNKNRSFYSPKDSGIYLSLVLGQMPINSGRVMMAIGYVLTEVLNNLYPQKFKIKWINDILNSKGKKIAGSLIEIHRESMIIGIGINLNTQDFPIEISDTAASITENQKTIRRELIIGKVIGQLYHLILNNPSSLIHQYKQVSDTINRVVTLKVGNQTVVGTAIDVDYDGRLLIQGNDGTKKYYNIGEVIKVNQGEYDENH